MKVECSKKKVFSRQLSLLTAITMTCSVLLIMPVATHAAYTLPVKVEAEACSLSNGATVTTNVYGTTYPGYFGDGFVWVAGAGTITLKVTIPKNAMYELSVRAAG
jgi:mannan endo-1,4-beta-mannosidase